MKVKISARLNHRKQLALFIIAFFVTGIGMHAQADRKYIRKGNGSYIDGNYKEAEKDYRKALENDPSSAKADYNLGNSLYKQGEFDAAAGRYNAVIQNNQGEHSRKATDKNEVARYYYNLGNAFFQSQKYRESIESYKMSLRNNPSDLDAKHNLQMAIRMMHEAEQQQQQGGDNKQDQDKDKEDKQQQQNKDQQQNNGQQNQNQDQQNQDQQQNEEQNQQQNQQQAQQDSKGINPRDAERILDALENQEKQTLKNVQDKKAIRQMEVEKNW